MYDNASRVIDVNIDDILPNRFQPRIQFDEEEILDLSDSIKEHGVIQPIVVRTVGDKYEIIAGERRYKASVLAGRETVPVIVKNLNDKDSAEIALIENVQRKNLTPIEEALSYKKILDMGYITQENLANKLGKSQSSIANKIRLLNLTDEVQEALLENKISERHARSLLKLKSSKLQNEMLNRIISERLTVRRTDEEILKIKDKDIHENNEEGKGEFNMNNNMFGISNVPETPQQNTQSFDIFGGAQQTTQSSVVQPTTNSSFDIFGETNKTQTPQMSVNDSGVSSTPMQSNSAASSMDSGNFFAPQPAMETMPTSSFDTSFQMSSSTMPTMPSVEQTSPFNANDSSSYIDIPTQSNSTASSINSGNLFTSQPTMETTSTSSFDINTSVQQPSMGVPTNNSVISNFEVPSTAPILESSSVEPQMSQQSSNLFSFAADTNLNQYQNSDVLTQTEFKAPEPIIVTDYSKQYDPVMPQSVQPVIPQVEFKEVINAIRECSKKIEQYGFKIDVEEYDMANLYQVIFKVEK